MMVLNVLFSLSATIASDPMMCNVKIEPLFPEYLLQSIYIHIQSLFLVRSVMEEANVRLSSPFQPYLKLCNFSRLCLQLSKNPLLKLSCSNMCPECLLLSLWIQHSRIFNSLCFALAPKYNVEKLERRKASRKEAVNGYVSNTLSMHGPIKFAKWLYIFSNFTSYQPF